MGAGPSSARTTAQIVCLGLSIRAVDDGPGIYWRLSRVAEGSKVNRRCRVSYLTTSQRMSKAERVAGAVVIELPRAIVKTSRSCTDMPNSTAFVPAV